MVKVAAKQEYTEQTCLVFWLHAPSGYTYDTLLLCEIRGFRGGADPSNVPGPMQTCFIYRPEVGPIDILL